MRQTFHRVLGSFILLHEVMLDAGLACSGQNVRKIQHAQPSEIGSTDEMMDQMDRLLIERGYLHPGDAVVFVAGQPIGRPGTTNLLKLHRIGELR